MKLLSYLLIFLSLSSGLPKNKATRAYSKEELFLGDASESQLREYYGDFSKYRKEELINYLYSIISKDNHFVSYNDVSKWYKITDRNYSISSQVNPTEYDFSLDEGTSYYTYNMYFSSSSNNDTSKAISNEVNKLKVDSSVSRVTYSYSADNKVTGGTRPNSYIQVDKEHVWPKNLGFKVKDKNGNDVFAKGAPTDLHNLVAADHNTNSAGHNDYYYGNVDNKTNENIVYAYLANGEKEVSGWKEKIDRNYIFEPTDEWKGNVARCLLYMATRYSNSKSDTQAEPYLVLNEKEEIPDLLKGEGSFCGEHINLSTLLKWHELDPVDEYERHRNNLIYYNVQNNRNPYIDFPNLALRAFTSDYDFSHFKEKYNIHLDDNDISFNIVLPSDESEFELVEVIYDQDILRLENNIKIIPLKEGSSEVIYHLLDTRDNTQLEFKTVVNIKPSLEYIGPSKLDLKSFEKYKLDFDIKNMHEDESVGYSYSSKTFTLKGDTINAKFIGKDELVISVKNDFKVKDMIRISVEVKLSPLMIILFVIGGLIIVAAIIIVIVILLKNKKKV